MTTQEEYIVDLLSEFFVSSWWSNNRNKCIEIVIKLNSLLHDEGVRNKFNQNKNFLTENFDYVSLLLPTTKNICVTKNISETEKEELCKQGKVYIYLPDIHLNNNYLLTSNPVIRDISQLKNIKYDILVTDEKNTEQKNTDEKNTDN